MRTEQDLRNALDRLAATAPDVTPVVDDLPAVRPARRRRTTLVLATVMATAAAIVGGSVVVDRLRATTPPPAGQDSSSPWVGWAKVTAPDGMIVNPRVYEPNRQLYQLAGVGSPWSSYCLLSLHRNGDFDPRKIPADSPRIDVNGLAGRLITMPDGQPIVPFPRGYAISAVGPVRPMTTLAWQPSRGLWALVSCVQQQQLGTREVPQIDAPVDAAADSAVAVARKLTATQQRVLSPFRIGYVPSGLKVKSVSDKTSNFTGDGHQFRVLFSDGNPRTGLQGADHGERSMWGPMPGAGDDLEITYTTDKFWNQNTRFEQHNPADLTIHAYKAWYTADVLGAVAGSKPVDKTTRDNGIRLEGKGMAITVRRLGNGPADKAELRRIAESLTIPGNPLSTDQWYDATTAIPR
ncbi:hypothetical protein [Kribbella swartbergensis]